jgi:hypothetical protein
MNNSKKITLLLLTIMISFISFAQGTGKATMADQMRSNGRIYVVVAVMLTILIGLLLYVVRLDRKISKLEKES